METWIIDDGADGPICADILYITLLTNFRMFGILHPPSWPRPIPSFSFFLFVNTFIFLSDSCSQSFYTFNFGLYAPNNTIRAAFICVYLLWPLMVVFPVVSSSLIYMPRLFLLSSSIWFRLVSRDPHKWFLNCRRILIKIIICSMVKLDKR